MHSIKRLRVNRRPRWSNAWKLRYFVRFCTKPQEASEIVEVESVKNDAESKRKLEEMVQVWAKRQRLEQELQEEAVIQQQLLDEDQSHKRIQRKEINAGSMGGLLVAGSLFLAYYVLIYWAERKVERSVASDERKKRYWERRQDEEARARARQEERRRLREEKAALSEVADT